jgi:hypothetical protein
LLWHSLDHIDAYGPKSKHARIRDEIAKPETEKPGDNGSTAGSTVDGTGIPQSGQEHANSAGNGSVVDSTVDATQPNRAVSAV